MSQFYHDLNFVLEKMETSYCTYPITSMYEWLKSYYNKKD